MKGVLAGFKFGKSPVLFTVMCAVHTNCMQKTGNSDPCSTKVVCHVKLVQQHSCIICR